MADDEILTLLRGVAAEQGFVAGAPEGYRRIAREGVLTMPLEEVDAWVQAAGGRIEEEAVPAPALSDQEAEPGPRAPEVIEYYVLPASVLG
jgi:hypothetical protein